jgi:uncharacterized protein YbbC (DUF1343 family)
MRSVTAATVYPGLGLHETALSVGRGTGTPFEVFGAPYIDDVTLASELTKANFPGLSFVPVRFTPNYSTFKDNECSGAAVIVTDRTQLNAVDFGITLALKLQRMYPEKFALQKTQSLLQSAETIEAIKAGNSLAEIKRSWARELEQFKTRRRQFLLYQ